MIASPLNILLPTDTFPPGNVGGAAWSACILAQELEKRGHRVQAVVPVRGAIPTAPPPIPTRYVPYTAPPIPFVQNYYRHERLWQPLAAILVQAGRDMGTERLIIHAQHVQTTPAAVLAGHRLGVPVVATIRDHWPWDYFATGLHANRLPYPTGTLPGYVTDLPVRLGAFPGTLALLAVPYMLAHLRRRAALLAQADAVIAVSHYIAHHLRHIVPAERLHVLPNIVNIAGDEQIAAVSPSFPIPDRFMLYVGKLEPNKGASLLPDIVRHLVALPGAPPPPLLVVGSGSLQAALQSQLDRMGVAVHFLSWLSHDDVLRLMARCEVLLFPSLWGEPLSRVLLEASALGAPILAMPTGGTPDIISDGCNGLLARTPVTFAHHLRHLLDNPHHRHTLGEQARRTARERFAPDIVLPNVEQLYQRLMPG